MPKDESEPITDDEWLIRLVYYTNVTGRTPTISPESFRPSEADTDGISLFRAACLRDPAQALDAIPAEKRELKAIVQVPVKKLSSLSIHVRPDPIAAAPGHVLATTINIGDYKADKPRFKVILLRLAEMASENIIRQPLSAGPR